MPVCLPHCAFSEQRCVGAVMIQACPLFRTTFRSQKQSIFLIAQRHISLNTAINRGIREDTSRNHHSRERFPRSDSRANARDSNNYLSQRNAIDSNKCSRERFTRLDTKRHRGVERSAPWTVDPSLPQDSYAAHEHSEELVHAAERDLARREPQLPGEFRRDERLSTRLQRSSIAPVTIPYTTAASEFLYGYSVVNAALKARRRRLYSLYLHTRALKHEGIIALRVRARNNGVRIHEVNDQWLPIMDKVSSGRPHNGFVLESSPLPRPPIVSMGNVSREEGFFTVNVDTQSQSREELQINGRQSEFRYKTDGWRHPLILYADGIVSCDPLSCIFNANPCKIS